MSDFSVIAQDPAIRAIVQDNALERAFHDMLFPNMIFRLDVEARNWEANTGDNRTFSAPGPIKPKTAPLMPGTDPKPSTFGFEQWDATMAKYADSVDTPMPTSITAIASMYLRNAQQLGLSAAQSLNRIVRNRLYNGALSGQSVVTANVNNANAIHVERLNGFTKARRPDLAAGSPVKYATVSASNPLQIKCGANLGTSVNVIGFVPDNQGDEVGPGTLNLDGNVTVNARDPVASIDSSYIVRSGGGTRTDDISANDLLTLKDLQSGVARLRNMNVPPHADGRYHCHLDPISEQEVFQDGALQSLLRSLPEYYMSQDFVLGVLYGMIFFRNNECPQTFTVSGGQTATYDPQDPFGAPLYSDGATDGVPLHFPLITGGGWMNEYYADLGKLITDAGILGKQGKWQITNNGIEVMADRIKMILRAPLNRTQDEVACTWLFMGDWPIRTDALNGDAARYKRGCVIEHG